MRCKFMGSCVPGYFLAGTKHFPTSSTGYLPGPSDCKADFFTATVFIRLFSTIILKSLSSK